MLPEAESPATLSIQAARAFKKHLASIIPSGKTILDEHFMREMKANVESRSFCKRRGIVIDFGGSSLKMCIVEIPEGSNSTVAILHAKTLPHDLSAGYMKNGTMLFDYMALEVTKFAKLHEKSFEEKELIPLGLIFSFDVMNRNFETCVFINNSKGFQLDDLKTLELNKLFKQKIRQHSAILLKHSIYVKTILNDMVSIFAGFYCDVPERVVSTMIIASGINMAYITEFEDNFHPGVLKRAVINTECGKIGDNRSFYQVIRDHLDPVDMKFLDSIGNEIRVAEKLSSGIHMASNFAHNIVYKFPYFAAEANQDVIERIQSMSFRELRQFHEYNSPSESNDCYLKQIPDALFAEMRNEFQRIVRRSASIVAAIAFVSINEDNHISNESVTIGVQGSIVENYREYREMLRENLLMIISDLHPSSRIKNIELRILKDSQIIGMTRICRMLHDEDF